MTANYHTHTSRCHHANGTDRDYIEAAIARGIDTLGFSDHVPMPFADGHQSGYRIRIEELEDYVRSLEALREEYRGRINILIGFEGGTTDDEGNTTYSDEDRATALAKAETT